MRGRQWSWDQRQPKARRALYGLGVISTDMGNRLVERVNTAFEAFDAMQPRLNALAQSTTVDRPRLDAIRDEYQALTDALTELMVRVDDLEDAEVAAWEAEFAGVLGDAASFERGLTRLEGGAPQWRQLSIVVVGGAAVLAAVGVGLFIRTLRAR